MTVNRFLSIVFICFLLVGCYLSSEASSNMSAIETTACSISANPERFIGKIVSFSAQLNSDGIERIVLTDDNCKKQGVGIKLPEHFEGEKEFEQALQQGHPGTLDKKITGTFVGVFIWQPQKVPKRVLLLKEVRNLSIVME